MKTGSHRRSCGATLRLAVCAAVIALVALGPSGCESGQNQASLSRENSTSELNDYSTAELRSRLDLLQRRYTEISREVELKSGLMVGVSIKDDRAFLGELYREAHLIERELCRRGDSTPPGEVRRFP